VYYNSEQYSAFQYNTVQSSTVQYSAVLCNAIPATVNCRDDFAISALVGLTVSTPSTSPISTPATGFDMGTLGQIVEFRRN
jgi:hypothetical protein